MLTPDELAVVAEAGGSHFLAQLSLPDADIFGQVNERAVDYASARAAELVTGIDETTRDELRSIISSGLEENIGLAGITERIKDAYSFSEERARLIAQTEVAMANQHGALEGMMLASKAGVKIKKLWLPDAFACDECLTNGDDGPIDLDATFATGDVAPPAHPNCRCSLGSEIEE